MKLLPVVVMESSSPTNGSTWIRYCLMIPFCSSRGGGPHDNCTDVELSGDTKKLVGDPDGTAQKQVDHLRFLAYII